MEITKTVINETHVQYTANEGGYIYQGTFVFTPEEYAKQTDLSLGAAIATEYAEWKAHMLAPIPIPTDEDKLRRLEQIARDQAALDAEAEKLMAELEVE